MPLWCHNSRVHSTIPVHIPCTPVTIKDIHPYSDIMFVFVQCIFRTALRSQCTTRSLVMGTRLPTLDGLAGLAHLQVRVAVIAMFYTPSVAMFICTIKYHWSTPPVYPLLFLNLYPPKPFSSLERRGRFWSTSRYFPSAQRNCNLV